MHGLADVREATSGALKAIDKITVYAMHMNLCGTWKGFWGPWMEVRSGLKTGITCSHKGKCLGKGGLGGKGNKER